MAVALVPYTWNPASPETLQRLGAGNVWTLPDNVTHAVDLRPPASTFDPESTGYALALFEGALPAGAVLLETSDLTRDRDAWQSVFNFRPQGGNAREWALSQLSAGADNSGEAGPRPFRATTPTHIYFNFGGETVWELPLRRRTDQLTYARHDLNAIRAEVEQGLLPPDTHRKVLVAMARELGVSWLELRPTNWSDSETGLDPTTSYTDPFKSGSIVALSSYGSWSAESVFTTGNGLLYIDGDIDNADLNRFAWHPTSVSSPNNVATLYDLTAGSSYHPAGVLCRGNGNNAGYCADHWATNHRLWRFVGGVGTQLATVTATAGSSRTLTVQASGSSISGTDTIGWRSTVVDTALTGGVRAGVWVYAQGTSSGQRTATAFAAYDLLTPTFTSISPSSGPAAGGTNVTLALGDIDADAIILLDGKPLTGLTVTAPTSATGTIPAGTPGPKELLIKNPASGLFCRVPGGFTYTDPRPVVTNNTASGVLGVGGTVQMAATNTPTAWALL